MTDRQITHAPDCWSWGPRHYECVLREMEMLVAEWKRVAAAQAELHGESEERAERRAKALRIARARAADLAAWLKSGNDVPADLPFVFRERWQKIANDIRALEAALAQEDCND